jgi:ABC-2 type transport system permease protein
MAQLENVRISIIDEDSMEKAIEKTKERKGKALLIVPQGFGKDIEEIKGAELEIYSIVKGLSIGEVVSSGTLGQIINNINREMALDFIQETVADKKAEDIIHPVRTKEFVVVGEKIVPGNPAMIRSVATSQSVMSPVIWMMVIMYAGIMVITSMGMEKENKTLETLLTLPVKRRSIVAGKMVGAAIVALIMAGVYMIGFSYYMSSFTSEVTGAAMTAVKELGLVMTPASYLLLGASLFLAILTALSLAMILGLFAQDARSAQTMNMPIVLLVMFPFFVLMFKDLENLPLVLKVILYLIPFSHPTIAAKALIFHDYLPVIGGMAYMGLFAATLVYITVRIFNTDKILTARFSFRKRKRSV